MSGSPANSRLELSGGQQAKRHRAVRNRGHGIDSLCFEVQDKRNTLRAFHTLAISMTNVGVRRNAAPINGTIDASH